MPVENKQTEWGFLILADRADDTADAELISRIVELIKSSVIYKQGNKIQLVFCLRAAKEFKEKVLEELNAQNSGTTITGAADLSKLMIYQSRDSTITFRNYDITMSQGISSIFADFYKGKVTSKYNGLITWGHGGVYSFFPKSTDNIDKVEKFSLQKYKMVSEGNDYVNYYYLKYGEILASDNYLNMGELKTGIQVGLGKKLDIVIMSNCHMAYYETANMMSFCSKLWIAALGYVQFNSIQFAEKLNEIHQSEATITPVEFAKNVLTKKNGNSVERVGAFIIYNLAKYYILRKILYNMAGQLLRELKKTSDICILKGIRDECTDTPATTGYHVVDLFEFCKVLIDNKTSGDQTLISGSIYSSAKQILNQPKAVIIPVFENELNKGLAIHFPESNYLVNEPADRLGNIPYKNHRKKWEYFVFKYLEAVTKNPCPDD